MSIHGPLFGTRSDQEHRLRGVFIRHIRLFLLALSFLTRLAPARSASTEDMARSCLYYPLAGLCLGVLLTLPFSYGLLSGRPLAQAFIYVLLHTWLTRALHHDGLADLLDALGSGKTGEAFWTILKDSRIGTFAALGLTLAVVGHLILAAACFSANTLGPLVFAPLFGRCLPAVLARIALPHPSAGLGALVAAAPQKACPAICLLLTGILGPLCLGFSATGLALPLAALVLAFLAGVARRQGGYNGDFFGTAILAGELAALIAAAAFIPLP